MSVLFIGRCNFISVADVQSKVRGLGFSGAIGGYWAACLRNAVHSQVALVPHLRLGEERRYGCIKQLHLSLGAYCSSWWRSFRNQRRPMDKSHFITIWGYCRQSCFITHSGITHCTSRFKLPVCARALLYRWNYSFMAAASENEVMLWWLLRLQVDLEKYSIL